MHRIRISFDSGWAEGLRAAGWLSGMYSGVADLCANDDNDQYTMPDHLWFAWWNGDAREADRENSLAPYPPPCAHLRKRTQGPSPRSPRSTTDRRIVICRSSSPGPSLTRGQQERRKRSSTRVPNRRASTGTRSSTPWNNAEKSRSAGS